MADGLLLFEASWNVLFHERLHLAVQLTTLDRNPKIFHLMILMKWMIFIFVFFLFYFILFLRLCNGGGHKLNLKSL